MKLFTRAVLALGALAFALAPAVLRAEPAFRPVPGSTVSLSATTSSASVTLGLLPSGGGMIQFRIYNAGAATVFVIQGACSGLTATTSHMPIPSGAVEVVSFDANDTRACLAGITASSTATLYVTTGYGS